MQIQRHTPFPHRITYRTNEIIQLLEEKQKDPFDIEVIVNLKLERYDYVSSKSFICKS